MRICGQERYGYRACGFVVSGGQTLCSGLFSHPMLLGIGYSFQDFVDVPSQWV